MMSPNTRIDWYPENGFADPENPTIAELNAGTNISCAIVTGYTLNFTDSDTDDSKTICDEGNVQNRGFANYEASLSFFRDAVGDAPTVFTTARNLFKTQEHITGFLVSRQGYKSAIAYAAGQHVNVFKVMSDFARDEEGDGGTPIQFTVPFLQQGLAYPNVEVTA
jgi:hypothetical protein